MATTYAPELVSTVFREQMLDDGWICELELQFAGPSLSEPVFDIKDESATQWAGEFDDHKGAQLPGNLRRICSNRPQLPTQISSQ